MLNQARIFLEIIVNLMLQMHEIEPDDYRNTHANRIELLKQKGFISQNKQC